MNAGCKSVEIARGTHIEIPLGAHIEIPHDTNVGGIREVIGASGFAHMGLMWEALG